MRSGLVATFLLVLILAWNEYLLALFLSNANAQTMPVLVSAQNTTRGPQWWNMSVLIVVMIVPVVVIATRPAEAHRARAAGRRGEGLSAMQVTLSDVRKSFGHVEVVKGLDLEVADGEFLVLLGPSGCGKTTALRMVAGLESVTSGRILIGERDVTNVLPKYRDIAMVFQSYALYPHMTVAENIAYPAEAPRTCPRPSATPRCARRPRKVQLDD